MRIDILTLFPEPLRAALAEGLCRRAKQAGRLELEVTDIRDYATDKHHTADDTPFGGGGGMVLLPEVVARAVDAKSTPGAVRVVLDPAGPRFTQELAKELSLAEHLILVCGHYKGIDERVIEAAGLRPVSIGDYVLSGGEPAAWVVTDAVVRLIPGVLGDFESAQGDSFLEEGLLGPAVYTRPAVWRGFGVPEVLLSGDHARIVAWRRQSMQERTRRLRPDLWAAAPSEDEPANQS